MWRGILGSLAAAVLLVGQAWAAPTPMAFAGMLNCPGSCQAGSTFTVDRDIPGDPGNPMGASFEDHYTFLLTENVNMNGTAFALNFLENYGVQDLAFEFFGAGMTSLGVISVPNGAGVQMAAVSFPGLAAGAYSLLVSGLIPAEFERGAYLLNADLTQAAISQVPLPPAIWLFLSGLVGLVSLSQVRRRATTA